MVESLSYAVEITGEHEARVGNIYACHCIILLGVG